MKIFNYFLLGYILLVVLGACSKGTKDNSEVDVDEQLKGKSILIDENAVSTDPSVPAFIARPKGSKPYYGFPLIEDLRIDGFCYGAITDFLEPDTEEGCTNGDGFVEAPDGSRAGIYWEVSDDSVYSVMIEPEDERWGVYYFPIRKPIQTLDDMKNAFEQMLPVLKKLHEKASSK